MELGLQVFDFSCISFFSWVQLLFPGLSGSVLSGLDEFAGGFSRGFTPGYNIAVFQTGTKPRPESHADTEFPWASMVTTTAGTMPPPESHADTDKRQNYFRRLNIHASKPPASIASGGPDLVLPNKPQSPPGRDKIKLKTAAISPRKSRFSAMRLQLD
jgi:hypothetical protein